MALGMRNIGNTCFLNAAVQCLAHVDVLRMYFCKCGFDFLNRPGVLRELGLVVRELWSDAAWTETGSLKSVVTWELLREIRKVNSLFAGFLQQDLHEVLLAMLDTCMEESSLVRDAFSWQTRSTLVCGNCQKRLSRLDDMVDLSVSVEQCATVEECIRAHLAPERLGTGNEWKCESCHDSHPHTTKELAWERLPQVLIIHLKRFRSEEKLTHHVAFPRNGLEVGQSKYELVGVVAHRGASLDRGHYVSYCKMPADWWAEFDDGRCTAVKPSDVLSQQAYVLVYRMASERPVPRRWAGKPEEAEHVLPLLYWVKVKTFADPGALADWTGPVVAVEAEVARQYGGMTRSEYRRAMRELCERRRKETAAVMLLPVKPIDDKWARKWLRFVQGRAGVPGSIPDQEDRNELFLYFKGIYP